jgi:heterodisulfide reductase subunit B
MQKERLTYGFFPGCAYATAAGYRESVEAVNRRLGIELVELSDWNCCGATSMFSLNQDDALILAGRLFALAEAQGHEQILTVCNACYTTLRKAGQMLAENPRELARVNEGLSREDLRLSNLVPVRHYLEILYEDVPPEAWSAARSAYTGRIRVAAYYGCQLTRPWEDLDHGERPSLLDRFLSRVGFQAVDHSARTICCGASHALPYTKDCQPMIRRIVEEARRRGAHLISTLCPLCQFNLDSLQKPSDALPIPVPYFSQLAGLVLGIPTQALGLDKLLISAEAVIAEIA